MRKIRQFLAMLMALVIAVTSIKYADYICVRCGDGQFRRTDGYTYGYICGVDEGGYNHRRTDGEI